jgi:hypothetical protein
LWCPECTVSKKELIALAELNPNSYPLNAEQEQNLKELQKRLIAFRKLWAKPMIITSGFRTIEDQMRIYRNKKRVPMFSCHLRGAAADVADRDGMLGIYCVNNIPVLEECGLWIEDPLRTPGWVHFQIFPPVSGNRVFQP